MKIIIKENFTETVNKQNHITYGQREHIFNLYCKTSIVAVLTYFEIFYVEVFFTGKHLVVFDPFSKFMVDLTRLCDLTQPTVPPFLVPRPSPRATFKYRSLSFFYNSHNQTQRSYLQA